MNQDGESKKPKSEGFTQIWNSFLDDPSLPGEAKLLGILYARHADKAGEAWPGLERLKSKTQWGRDVVQRARSLLRNNGLLTRKAQHKGGRLKGVKFQVSERIRVHRKPETQSH